MRPRPRLRQKQTFVPGNCPKAIGARALAGPPSLDANVDNSSRTCNLRLGAQKSIHSPLLGIGRGLRRGAMKLQESNVPDDGVVTLVPRFVTTGTSATFGPDSS